MPRYTTTTRAQAQEPAAMPLARLASPEQDTVRLPNQGRNELLLLFSCLLSRWRSRTLLPRHWQPHRVPLNKVPAKRGIMAQAMEEN